MNTGITRPSFGSWYEENGVRKYGLLIDPETYHLLAEWVNAKRGLPLTVTNYKLRLQLLNQIEEDHAVEEFHDCSVLFPILVPKPELASIGVLYQISRQQLGDCKANIKEGVIVCFSVSCFNGETELFGTVDNVDENCVTIYMEEEFEYNNVIKLEFFAQRTTFQREYRALEMLEQSVIEKICFANSYAGNKSLDFSSFDWFRPSVASNPEQMQAIRNIVNQTSFPAPYVLFGPPGTGKTSTLAEAIGQIYKLRPSVNVLAVATSNMAANELTSRLLEIIPKKDVFRFIARSYARKIKEIDRDVLNVSNLRDKKRHMFKIKQVYTGKQPYRVVLCSVSTAGRFMNSGIPKNHFSYIFIDECGSAKEISSLVPIVGIGVHGCEITASIVLAGDLKQLGPVIPCNILKDTSHSVSLLERIAGKGLYAKNPKTRKYDPKVITLLKNNFRSHPALIDFSKRMFYSGLLQATAASEKTNWAVDWERLPNRNFPLIFHPVVGEIKQDENSSSMYNEQEAEQVLSYVETILNDGICGKKIEQSAIGIITPYASQVRYLKDLLGKRGWSKIEVGSTEQYQGREKPIMLMSTVRTGSKSVGFLANPKRLNVSLTRAQALMIVVGDPETLRHDRYWAKFIKYCRQNNAISQSMADFPVKTVAMNSKTCNRSGTDMRAETYNAEAQDNANFDFDSTALVETTISQPGVARIDLVEAEQRNETANMAQNVPVATENENRTFDVILTIANTIAGYILWR